MKNTLSLKKALLPFCTFCFLLFTFQVNAQPGALDSSFAENGKLMIFPPADWSADPLKLAVQSDGKIILGGIGLSRYLPNGRRDSSFGISQKYAINVNSLAIQKDDKIVIADNQVYRYMPDGVPDSSFGVNGVYQIPLEENTQLSLTGVVVDQQGRIIAGGTYFIIVGIEQFYSYPYAIRLTKDGKPDETFGKSGVCIVKNGNGPSCLIRNIALGKNGKTALVGDNALGTSPSTDVFVAMLTNDGKIDSTFNNKGYIYTRVDMDGQTANNAYIKDDGKILVTGSARITGFNNIIPQILLIQYNSDGSLNETFGKGGFTEAAVYSQCYGNDMAVQQNGKIVITGQCRKKSGSSDFVISRFLPNGIIDSSFGQDGFNVTDFGWDEYATCVTIKKDGNIVAAGNTVLQLDDDPDILMCSYIGDPVNQHPLITKIKRWIKNHILHFTDNNPNTAYYAVEQQTGSGAYKQIASLNKSEIRNQKSKSEYSFALPSVNYQLSTINYRIKAINKDNSFTYSDAIADNDQLTNQPINQLTISPNPATNFITLCGLGASTKYELRIMNKEGRQVYSINPFSGRGINISSLLPGIYFLEVKDSEGAISSLKFVKE